MARPPPAVIGHAVGRGNTGAVLGQKRTGPLALSSPGVFFYDAVPSIICDGYRCGAPGALPNSGGYCVNLNHNGNFEKNLIIFEGEFGHIKHIFRVKFNFVLLGFMETIQ